MSNRLLKKIPPSQINILIFVMFFLIVVSLVWLYIFLPQKSGLKTVRLQMDAVEQELADAATRLPPDVSIEYEINKLNDQYLLINRKFPEKENPVIQELMEILKKGNLNVLSMQMLGRQPVTGENQKPLVMEGKAFELLPVVLKMRGNYQNIIQLFQELRRSVEAYVGVEVLKMTVVDAATGELDIQLTLNLVVQTSRE